MTSGPNTRRCVWLFFVVALSGNSVFAQEPLTVAKVYYASAAYDDALRTLESARPLVPSREAAEVAAYRAFCLLALGRTEEARAEVEALVRIDPLYKPGEEQASPRVRAFFDEVRRPILDDVARQAFTSARAAFEREDLAGAASDFERVIKVVDDMGSPAGAALADLRTLAAGFKDLIDVRIAAAEAADKARELEAASAATGTAAGTVAGPAAAAGAAPAAGAEAPVVAESDRVYSEDDAGIVRPQVISRAVPQWTPGTAVDAGREFSGVVEVIVDRDGRVETSVMRGSVHPLYDPILLRAAKAWRFTPASKDGVPVKFRYRLGVKIGG